ncbi:hypothetical protein ACJ72_01767 [Emergomyces africanus]|uniref:Uncharacterized protein n=1 Tax=Emergomyces africanus TaxID=1955775 RepID=A0A1B7P4B3_9EURO|nr:hypothetical protein ACJ72_01767 [Emergomyces africanus]
MNRYRNIPSLRSTSKATATTLCQKCLKRDKFFVSYLVEFGDSSPADKTIRHYSYECKASAQERPYISRPSRTQQLANPKLVPELMSDVPNDLLRTKGVADEQLALKESERARKRADSEDDRGYEGTRGHSRKRVKSVSPAYSADSVSTISTKRSWSRSPPRKRNISPSPHRSREHKRKLSRSVSQDSHFSSSSVERKAARSTGNEGNTRRRRRGSHSPIERGRRHDSSRRGSWRNRSRSQSMDRSSIAKQRRSLTPEPVDQNSRRTGRDHDSHPRSLEEVQDMPRRPARAGVHEPPHDRGRGRRENPPPRKERSLSPFSKRLALTQAMNMNR